MWITRLPTTNRSETVLFVCVDVDDLQDIGKLERYVALSQCVLIFLSKDYFSSANCIREVQSTLGENKPIVLVHETDPKKGGVPLASLRAECATKDCSAVLDAGGEVIPWHRVADFQLLSLKMVAIRMLHCMPEYKLKTRSRPVCTFPARLGGGSLCLTHWPRCM